MSGLFLLVWSSFLFRLFDWGLIMSCEFSVGDRVHLVRSVTPRICEVVKVLSSSSKCVVKVPCGRGERAFCFDLTVPFELMWKVGK